MHYVIWPEGQPEDVYRTTNRWKAQLYLLKRQAGMLLKPAKARRMRVASCIDGFPIPEFIEASLEKVGAIAPPGGWPVPNTKFHTENSPTGDVMIRVFSVV